MNEIRRVLKRAAWRLLAVDFLHTLAVTLSAGIIGLIAMRLAQQVLGVVLEFPRDWYRLVGAAVVAAIVAALVWSTIRRAKGITVARELDERADLRESLSTAMCVASSPDPWAAAVVETARDKATRVDVKRAIPIVAPRVWPVPLALALSLVVVWFTPRFDLTGAFKRHEQKKEEQREITEVKAEVKQIDDKLKELLQKAKVDLSKDESTNETNENKPQSAEEIRRAAVKKLTNQVDRLGELKQGDKAKQMDAMKQAMKQLKQPGPGPLEQLSKAMQKGDFAKAQEQLQELSKQMANNSMSPEDKAKAQEQMKKLAEQMDKLSQDRQNLEKQLQQSGMDKDQAAKAAKDPEALKQALDQMKNMSEAEKQELMKNAMAQMKAMQECKGMASQMGEMAKGMNKEGMNKAAQEAAENLAGQLSDMEMMSKEMDALEAAMDEASKKLAKLGGKCKGGECNGEGSEGQELAMSDSQSPWKAGESANNRGKGSGGPGQSGGGRSPQGSDAPVQIDKVKSPTKQGSGPVIGSRLVYGDQVRGESVAEFSSAVEAGSKAAAEAIESMTVPKELQGTVKHYFGRLDAAKSSAKPAEKPAPSK